MKIRLYHGRKNPEQEMDDWGFDGSILNGVDGIVWTYGMARVFFVNDSALEKARELTGWEKIGDSLEMCVCDNLIETGCLGANPRNLRSTFNHPRIL